MELTVSKLHGRTLNGNAVGYTAYLLFEKIDRFLVIVDHHVHIMVVKALSLHILHLIHVLLFVGRQGRWQGHAAS